MNIIDLIAKEYGWTIPEITDLTYAQFTGIQNAIGMRYKAQADAMENAANGGTAKTRRITSDMLPSNKKVSFRGIK